MTEEELRALVRQGEGQRTEFKAAEADAADIARAGVAMANSGGGTILLGVGDDGDLLGLWYAQPGQIARHIRTMPNLGAWRQWVVNVSRHNCEPAVPIGLERVAAGVPEVLVIHVPDGQDKPYRANGRVYLRIDREEYEATWEEIGRLMFESGRVQYERLPVTDAQLSELDDVLLPDYFVEVRQLPYPEDAEERARLLVNLGFATRRAGDVVPTVAGVLLLGVRPQDRLPAARLKCAFYYGLHQGAQLRDRADVVGPLTRVIDEGEAVGPCRQPSRILHEPGHGAGSSRPAATICTAKHPQRLPATSSDSLAGRPRGRSHRLSVLARGQDEHPEHAAGDRLVAL